MPARLPSFLTATREAQTMTTRITATFTTASWEEKPHTSEDAFPRVTYALVANDFKGVLEGQASQIVTMTYLTPTAGSFVALEKITGTLDGRAGSFVLEHRGTYAGTTVTSTVEVVPGSGTAELTGLRGTGSYVAEHGTPHVELALNYSLGG
jgi:hypothetical protein